MDKEMDMEMDIDLVFGQRRIDIDRDRHIDMNKNMDIDMIFGQQPRRLTKVGIR